MPSIREGALHWSLNVMNEEGIGDNVNVDIFLNLEKIEDVEMSSDSAKRK